MKKKPTIDLSVLNEDIKRKMAAAKAAADAMKPSPADVKGLIDPLLRLAAKCKETRAAVEAWLRANKQKPVLCPHHSHVLRPDAEEMARHYHRTRQIVVIRERCGDCLIEAERLHRMSWLLKAGVPSNMVHCDIANWKPRTRADSVILSETKRFIERRKGFLILSGPAGLGKTHLGVACLAAAGKGRMITQDLALMKLRQTYRDRYAEDIVEACKTARMLVLDEIGVSAGGRDELPMLHQILSHRYGESLPTVLTTNLPMGEEFDSVMGTRITDRFREAAVVCIFEGESMRASRRGL